MTSSPERTSRDSFPQAAPRQRGFVPADTTPAPAPRAFVASRGGSGEPQEFSGLQLPRTQADEAALTRVREAAKAAGYAEGWAHG
ncbi:hypothetical protein, partial [Kineococcus glutinatus]|uniref:hypothetical protein n=1 Tax=Kineococcus glutinatus TaxID=1070872 RepID=UPI0031E98096